MELLIWLMALAVVVAALATGLAAWIRARRRVAAGIPSLNASTPVRAGVVNGLIGLLVFTVVAVVVVWISSMFL